MIKALILAENEGADFFAAYTRTLQAVQSFFSRQKYHAVKGYSPSLMNFVHTSGCIILSCSDPELLEYVFNELYDVNFSVRAVG